MESTLSAEEFQRFQNHLLDLREAQISANEAKLRAENRAKQLEEELLRSKAALVENRATFNHLAFEELKQENKLLRDKLLSTESSFQLQSSTLRAECHRLSSELNKFRDASFNRSLISQACQISAQVSNASVQTISQPEFEAPIGLISDYFNQLESSLEIANNAHSRLLTVIDSLGLRVEMLEKKLSSDMADYQNRLADLMVERESLQTQLNASLDKINQSKEIEKELSNQIEGIKRRSEKLNRELRRQLSRFLRGGGCLTTEPETNLCRTSLHSSSSSLSSNLNSTFGGWISNGSVAESNFLIGTGAQSQKAVDSTQLQSSTHLTFVDMPTGFFSMADFKALIDRMSEVQEENCTLRRQNKRLELDLIAKSRIVQKQIQSFLQSPNDIYSSTASDVTTNRSNDTINNANDPHILTSNSVKHKSESHFPNLSWLSFGKHTTTVHTNSSPTNLSVINLQTINRLKLMCEQLLTQNIQLNEQLLTMQTKD